VRSRAPERPPVPILALALVGTAFFAMPFIGLLWRLPWSATWRVVSTGNARDAL